MTVEGLARKVSSAWFRKSYKNGVGCAECHTLRPASMRTRSSTMVPGARGRQSERL